MNRDRQKTRMALMIGIVSWIAYFGCYFAKNILSVVSPQMIENAMVDEAFIGTLSSINMWTYAVGQLVNGVIGEKIRAKYLVGAGLFLAGICNVLMGITDVRSALLIAYGLIGFFFSMLYAPLTKLIAENMEQKQAENACLGLTFASLVGAPAAGIAAFWFSWNKAFVVCGVFLIFLGILFFVCVTELEKRGGITYGQYVAGKEEKWSFKGLLEHEIITFSLVSVLTGIVRTSVAFWIPTYLTQELGLTVEWSATIFTVMMCLKSVGPYIGNWLLYERVLKRSMRATMFVSFLFGTIGFLLMFFLKAPLWNTLFLGLAMFAESIATNVLWSIYCPGLRDTGMVSSATGYLDFLSYAAAGAANLIFANAITAIGWNKLILVWAALMGVGVVISYPGRKRRLNL